MTTPIRIAPCATSVMFESTWRKVRSVWISWRITTATIGPKTPPRPPARLTPPRTTAATLSSVYGPGTGVPMPVLAVSESPPRAENRPVRTYAMMIVRLTGTPLR